MRRIQSSILFPLLLCAMMSVGAFLVPKNNHSRARSQVARIGQLHHDVSGSSSQSTFLFAADGEEDKVQVGSKEYLEGFISSPIQDETVPERGTGLEQALKLAGAFSIALVALFAAFMASNGLL
jgi:hypothetical protein